MDLSCVCDLNAVVFQKLSFILRHFKRTLVFTTEKKVPQKDNRVPYNCHFYGVLASEKQVLFKKKKVQLEVENANWKYKHVNIMTRIMQVLLKAQK